MANIIHLPTAAAEPVINPKRCGKPPRNVTRRGELAYRRHLRENARVQITESASANGYQPSVAELAAFQAGRAEAEFERSLRTALSEFPDVRDAIHEAARKDARLVPLAAALLWEASHV